MIDISKLREHDFLLRKQLNKDLLITFFKWYEVGSLGVGRHSVPFVDMSKYFAGQEETWTQMNKEITSLFNSRTSTKQTQFPGHGCYIPTSLNDKKWLTHFSYYAEKYLPAELITRAKDRHEINQWIYENVAVPDWSDRVMVTHNTQSRLQWQDWQHKHRYGFYPDWISQSLPTVVDWCKNQVNHVFDYVGRVIIFKNNKTHPVGIHRDYYLTNKGLNLHSINFQFDRVDRPFFVYDEVTKEKFYTKGCKAYTFNDLDCHGLDSEDYDSYTFRIDGVFNQNILKELDLPHGYVWNDQCASWSKLNNLKIYEPDYEADK